MRVPAGQRDGFGHLGLKQELDAGAIDRAIAKHSGLP